MRVQGRYITGQVLLSEMAGRPDEPPTSRRRKEQYEDTII
nr:MAG TPA: hypothetical protein [Caudoviricetes sp.]